MLRVRINEGQQDQPDLAWDSVWQPQTGSADWALAGQGEPQNQGGLRAKAALHTAVCQLLFTDRRLPPDHPLAYLVPQDADPRGWFGDGVDVREDLKEGELGSLLWIFERAPLTEDIGRWVQAEAVAALQPLIAQGAAARIEAQVSVGSAINQCDLAIQIYGRSGAVIYDQRFQDLWRQAAVAPPAPPFPQLPTT